MLWIWKLGKEKLNSCPNCDSHKLWLSHGMIHHIWWVECSECHWCGRDSKTVIGAMKFWNKKL